MPAKPPFVIHVHSDKTPVTARNCDIIMVEKYESSGAASTARSMVTQRWRSCDMSTIRIPLSSRKYPGLYALIDEADFELVRPYRWFPLVSPDSRTVYAVANRAYGQSQLRMHRLILGDIESMQEVDHVDGDGLNNTRNNLRLATSVENSRNIRLRSDSTSGFKGVSWHKQNGAWRAYINVGGRHRHIGCFSDVEEAARAYDRRARELFGEFASLNFPEEAA